MKKTEKKATIPDIKEFTDDNGKKWVQTSTDDLFSLKELNEIIVSLEKEREKDEVVLARIDFQKVDREFYDAAVELQTKLQKQQKLLQKYMEETKRVIDRKNKKLRELIDYIKQLHQLISYLNANPEDMDMLNIPFTITPLESHMDEFISEYEEVEEKVMSPDDTE
jgi:hypothetical protein